MIVVIDYGAGNIGSIQNMLRRAGAEAKVSADPTEVAGADKLILPGVGHFDHGVQGLRDRGLIPAIEECVLNRAVPLLGICLGAQLLARSSEEGHLPGLGLIDADVKRFDRGRIPDHLKIPHMGWADVEIANPNELFADLPPEPRFYFVHTYHLVCDREESVIARATHGYSFVAAAARGHVVGVQFHPEKSHLFGLKLLESFARAA